MALWRIWNGPAPTTAALSGVTTGTAIKTMLQVLGNSNVPLKVRAWGVSMDGSAAAAGVEWELLTTGTVAATVTAHVAAGIIAIDGDAIAGTQAPYFSLGSRRQQD